MLAANDQIELVLDDLLHVEEFPVVEVLSQLKRQVGVQVSQLWRSATQVSEDFEQLQTRVNMRTTYQETDKLLFKPIHYTFCFTEFIDLSSRFLELEGINHTLSDVVNEDRLSSSSAVISDDVEVVPEVSLLDPMSDEVVLHTVDSSRSKYRSIRECVQHSFLSVELGL